MQITKLELPHFQTITFQFATLKVIRGGCFNFLKKIRPERNSENFGILQSHNQLSAKHLHNSQLFTVDNSRVAASSV